ncbi:MAG: bifunctional folylpolyglutamate synthase/dihydrofolate synthase [Bacteroidaceae bacterium]|nr:bifunctional folylpolyglutamate synthase/dihydrofolate synthase [Bacteroidaceae bacterium]
MTYQETIEYLYTSAPLFQNIGAGAYKEGLSTTKALDQYFNHPHTKFKTIHVGGTNGKGSTSHTLAAILQSAGYRVGLYTSPHLVDFRERIRVNGEMINEDYVVKFVEEHKSFFEPLYPSFFELATALAFNYFEVQKVDVAVIEVGLGGRLDCTNIITPVLSVITNISFDHTQFLGHTLESIAREKAGIIKPGVTTVIGESTAETKPVFIQEAEAMNSLLLWAEEQEEPSVHFQLQGACQSKNKRTIWTAAQSLKAHFNITDAHIANGFAHVVDLTHLRGRWEIVNQAPLTICDTGHNVAGWDYLSHQLQELIDQGHTLHIIFGMVADKDISEVIKLLPPRAHYYITQAQIKRALEANALYEMISPKVEKCSQYPSVKEAYTYVLSQANPEDVIFIGGSTFIVADFLSFIKK